MILNWKRMGGILIILIFIQISIVQCASITLVQTRSDSTLGSTNNPQIFKFAGKILSDDENNCEMIIPDNLYINELMADNDHTITDTNGTYSDWIELYNAGSETINLSCMYLTDDLNDPPTWQFPNGTMIKNGEYLLIWADDTSNQTDLHVPFQLKANGDYVALIAADGKTVIDSVKFGKQIRDTSYGRTPDGGSEWNYFTQATPGSANITHGSDYELSLKIVLGLLLILGILLYVFYPSKKLRTKKEKI